MRLSNLGNHLNAALKYRRGADSMTEFSRKIEQLTKNIMRYKLEEYLNIFYLERIGQSRNQERLENARFEDFR